jgi:quercetin dioxygenase-like cupin family protein
MPDAFFAIKDLDAVPFVPGATRRAAIAGKAMATFFTFAPGTVVPEHSHPHDQMSVVIRGRAEFNVAGEVKVLGPGEGARMPSGIKHSVIVLEDEAEIWDIWAPPREEYL